MNQEQSATGFNPCFCCSAKFRIFYWFLVPAVLFVSGLLVAKYFLVSSSRCALSEQTTSATSLTCPKISPTSLPEKWSVATFGNSFSYEYPSGWHVAEIWEGDYSKNGVAIAIDPKPINMAPRGGPRSTFQIRVFNGIPNPDEFLVEEINRFTDKDYSDIEKKEIDAEFGKIYHFRGKVRGEMYKGEPIELYFTTLNKSASDKVNQQVIVAELVFNNDPKISEQFRHVILSIKEL